MERMTEHDWYAYLQLPPDATTEDIEEAVERMSRQAGALATTSPERSQLLRETVRAIKRDLLSGPESRRRYDTPRGGRHRQPVPPATVPPPTVPPAAMSAYPAAADRETGSRIGRFLRTGWTCAACGKGAVPGDKFCARCGGPIQPIRPAAGAGHTLRPRPVCAFCANPLGTTDVFCSQCGARR
jgi:Double zinc ribbon